MEKARWRQASGLFFDPQFDAGSDPQGLTPVAGFQAADRYGAGAA